MKAISLFSGIGGFEIAMQRAGIEVVATCEIDDKARNILQARFPLTKHYKDIKDLTGEQLEKDGFNGPNRIITAGFPCQDLSIAGLRKGLAGQRSGLFHEIIRLTDELKPQFLILENVAGLLSSKQGKDMGIVITALVERGYGLCWRVLDSQNFGVAQRRRRVFIVASLGNHRQPVQILFESESRFWNLETSRKKRKASTISIETSTDESDKKQLINNLPPTLLRMRGGKEGGGKGALLSENKSLTIATANDQTLFIFENENETEKPLLAQRQSNSEFKIDIITSTITAHESKQFSDLVISKPVVRRLTPTECERLQGFPDGWTAGQADATRYKQIGNAVTVPVVEWIINRVVKQSMATEAMPNAKLRLD
jgi:DNA (cytosine-5)-methyltransferase 1